MRANNFLLPFQGIDKHWSDIGMCCTDLFQLIDKSRRYSPCDWINIGNAENKRRIKY